MYTNVKKIEEICKKWSIEKKFVTPGGWGSSSCPLKKKRMDHWFFCIVTKLNIPRME